MLGKLLGPDIQDMLDEKRLRDLREALIELPPYDIAELITDLELDRRAIVFRILPRALASDVFEKMPVGDQQELLESLSTEQCRQIVEEMDPDDRTALLEELPARVTRKLLRLLSAEERQVARALLAYPEASVGRLMTPDYIELRAGMTTAEALDFIRQVGMDRETVYVCYVTRQSHILEGVVGLRRLVLAPPETLVEDLMVEPSAIVHTNDDQEDVARALQDYDLLALPVVDSDRRLVGIVTVDDVLDVVEEEASEDMQLMAGVLPQTEHGYLDQRILGISWRRGVPLLGLVFGEFGTALVVGSFHAQIGQVLALAFFMPLVMATGGGFGVQTAALVVRGMSTGEVRLRDFWLVLSRELRVYLILSSLLGVVAMGLGLMIMSQNPEWGANQPAERLQVSQQTPGEPPSETPFEISRPVKIGIVIASSFYLVMFFSVVTGVVMPMLFKVVHLDPAVMTSPLLTTSVDMVGLLIYFLVAKHILGL